MGRLRRRVLAVFFIMSGLAGAATGALAAAAEPATAGADGRWLPPLGLAVAILGCMLVVGFGVTAALGRAAHWRR